MVKTTSYSPTNKRFRSHFQDFASTKAKKGHLNNNERDTDEIKHERGVLVKIEKNKIDSNGWIVEVGQGEIKKHMNAQTLPEYYPFQTVPKQTYIISQHIQ